MHLRLHPFLLAKSHLSFGILHESFLILIDRRRPCLHVSYIHHHCLLQGTRPRLELTLWRHLPTRLNVREKFTRKTGQILLLTACSPMPTGCLLNERLHKWTGKSPRSLGFCGCYSQLWAYERITESTGVVPLCLSGIQVQLLPKNGSDCKTECLKHFSEGRTFSSMFFPPNEQQWLAHRLQSRADGQNKFTLVLCSHTKCNRLHGTESSVLELPLCEAWWRTEAGCKGARRLSSFSFFGSCSLASLRASEFPLVIFVFIFSCFHGLSFSHWFLKNW